MTRQQTASANQGEATGETSPDGTLILAFQSSELWKNKLQLRELPAVWYFVTSALANECDTCTILLSLRL